MSLMVFNLPVTNTIAYPIQLHQGAPAGVGLLTLAPGAAAVVNATFDRIRVVTPTLPHRVYVLNPAANVEVHPGGVGYFRPGPPTPAGQPTYVFSVGVLNQAATAYSFA